MGTLVIMGLVVYILVVSGLAVWIVRHINKRKERGRRPAYECGNAISDWERAAARSLEWSRERRNKGEQ